MAYVKTVWASDTTMTTALFNNFETQFDEFEADYNAHDHDASYYTQAEMDAGFWCEANDGTGSGMDADQIYYATGNLHAAAFSSLQVPTGLIVMYPEAAAPSGWHICDGNDGTLNLENKFLVCAGTGSSYSVGETGGYATRTPSSASVTIGGTTLTTANIRHSHTLTDRCPSSLYTQFPGIASHSALTLSSTVRQTSTVGGGGSHTHPGTYAGSSYNNLPPYYALTYIQKT